MEEPLKSLSLDYLNLLINGQAFSDVAFSVEGRLVHAHRCVLAARSPFFRKFFSYGGGGGAGDAAPPSPPPPALLHPLGGPLSPPPSSSPSPSSSAPAPPPAVIAVSAVSYEVFLLVLQFLYSGQVSLVPQRHEPRTDCGDRGCWHAHCTAAVDLALDTLAAARSFGIDQLVLLTQKQLAAMVEKASIEDVMKVLLASRKQELHQLWAACSHLVAKSGLPAEVLAKHLPIDIVARIEELRLSSSLRHHHHHHHHHHQRTRRSASSPFIASLAGPSVDLDAADQHHHKIRRMRRALDSSDVELVKLMVMGEGLNLDEVLALHYAVENCSREVAKALLELGAADVNRPAGPAGKTPLHVAAEMVDPDMVAVLLDHHADPTARTVDGVTPLDVLRNLTSDFLFKGAVPGLSHVEPNKLRLCLELVQSAAMVMSREEAAAADPNSAAIYPPMDDDAETSGLDSRMVYLNLGMAAAAAAQLGCKMSSEGEENESSSSRSQGRGMNIGPPSMFSSLGFP